MTAPQVVTQRTLRTVLSRAQDRQTISHARGTRTVIRALGGRRTVLRAAGATQGPPGAGVAQIYDQAAAPAAIPGHTLLWFKSAVSADPNDRELYLVQ